MASPLKGKTRAQIMAQAAQRRAREAADRARKQTAKIGKAVRGTTANKGGIKKALRKRVR